MAQIVTCPECQKNLQVPDNLAGKNVQCPECKNKFAVPANLGFSSAPPPPAPAETVKPPAALERNANPDDDAPRRRRDEDDDSLDDDDGSRGRTRRFRPSYEPHRGGLILTLGILSLVFSGACAGVVLGPIAWMLGNTDLAEIRSGRMDPDGEGMTQAGRILGMIGAIMSGVVLLVTCAYFAFIFLCMGLMVGAGAAGAAKQNQMNRKF